MAKIIIPTPLRKFTSNQATIITKGTTVFEAIQDLAQQHTGIQQHLFDKKGKIRSFVRIFVGDDDILALNREKTAVDTSTVISIIPAIAGG